MVYVPPSGEVLAEQIQDELAESIPREEQGELIRAFVREIGDMVAETLQLVSRGEL